MANHSRKLRGLTIGLDLGDRRSHMHVLDRRGECIHEDARATEATALGRFFGHFGPSVVALEAGTHSPWVSRLAEEHGHRVIVANPRKLRAIYDNDRKTDRADARYLARLARVDPGLLSPLKHRSRQAQCDLTLLRSRDQVVRVRAQLINHVRGTLKAFGERVPSCSAGAFGAKAVESIPADLEPALEQVVEQIARLTGEIRRYEKKLEEVGARRYPVVERFRQIPGVGPMTAAAYALVVEEPGRFARSRTVGAYAGLVPRKDQSGSWDPQLGITKAGNPLLRRLLVQAAHYVLGPFGQDSDLRRYGLGLVKRGGSGAKKRAIIAVARKLAVVLHRLWVTGEDYDPFHRSRRQKRQMAAKRDRKEGSRGKAEKTRA